MAYSPLSLHRTVTLLLIPLRGKISAPSTAISDLKLPSGCWVTNPNGTADGTARMPRCRKSLTTSNLVRRSKSVPDFCAKATISSLYGEEGRPPQKVLEVGKAEGGKK